MRLWFMLLLAGCSTASTWAFERDDLTQKRLNIDATYCGNYARGNSPPSQWGGLAGIADSNERYDALVYTCMSDKGYLIHKP